jgi:hypothetical protein
VRALCVRIAINDMSKTLLKKIAFYLTDEEVERVNKARGLIPASRVGAIAVRRLLDDLEKGKVNLLAERGRTNKK